MFFCSVAALVSVALLFGGCARSRAFIDGKPDATHELPVASGLPQMESPGHSGPDDKDQRAALLDDAALSRALPEQVRDFEAGPLYVEPQFVRREYTRGNTKISVTIAKPGATPMTYDEWVNMSASSPQVILDIFPKAGSGFYDCAPQGTDELCHIHIHLRSGHHVEMMGQQNAHRADFDALLRRIRLSALSNV
jgi:hypothetical protein